MTGIAEDAKPPGFDEHAVVKLRRAIKTDEAAYAAGSIGVVVYRHRGGVGYEVEFGNPPGVATVSAQDLVPAD